MSGTAGARACLTGAAQPPTFTLCECGMLSHVLLRIGTRKSGNISNYFEKKKKKRNKRKIKNWAMGLLTAVRAVVSGGASGLGRATVERLIKSGGRVVIMDLPTSQGGLSLRTPQAKKLTSSAPTACRGIFVGRCVPMARASPLQARILLLSWGRTPSSLRRTLRTRSK